MPRAGLQWEALCERWGAGSMSSRSKWWTMFGISRCVWNAVVIGLPLGFRCHGAAATHVAMWDLDCSLAVPRNNGDQPLFSRPLYQILVPKSSTKLGHSRHALPSLRPTDFRRPALAAAPQLRRATRQGSHDQKAGRRQIEVHEVRMDSCFWPLCVSLGEMWPSPRSPS